MSDQDNEPDAATTVGPAPDAPKKAMWQPQTVAEVSTEKVTVARAIGNGVKQAFAPVYDFLDLVGGHLILVGKALAWLPRRPFRWQNLLEATEYIGFGSLPIILLVGAFTGMVM